MDIDAGHLQEMPATATPEKHEVLE